MSIAVVRYKTKPDKADENQKLIENVFHELNRTQPAGLRYSAFRLGDGVSFVHVASTETEDGTNPLSSTAAFSEFLQGINERCEEGPIASDATVVGSYEFWPAGSAS